MKKRLAVVGVSNRAMYLFLDLPLKNYKRHCDIVAMLDRDRSRMLSYNSSRNTNIPIFGPDEFEKMLTQCRPDIVAIACCDADHHHYVIDSLRHGVDVIVEKPLTTDEKKCAAIAKAARENKAKITVTFNYRYTPATTKIREIIADGKVGRIVSVDLNWYLDTYHGSSYFQRWNRLREVSGGLSVHKACHHFDLVRWWIGQNVSEVFAYGALNFYGPNGVHNPLTPQEIGDGRTCPTCNKRTLCKYYMRWNRDEYRSGGTAKIDDHIDIAQKYDGYSPRQCIYDPAINIEDTYAAVIRYNGGVFLNYSLNGSVPYEGFRLGINGTEGRIEYKELHGENRIPFTPDPCDSRITYIPMFGGREQIDVVNDGGGHGGGDPLLLDELLIGHDSLLKVSRTADWRDGIESVLTGVAVYKSVLEHRSVSVDELRSKIFQA